MKSRERSTKSKKIEGEIQIETVGENCVWERERERERLKCVSVYWFERADEIHLKGGERE